MKAVVQRRANDANTALAVHSPTGPAGACMPTVMLFIASDGERPMTYLIRTVALVLAWMSSTAFPADVETLTIKSSLRSPPGTSDELAIVRKNGRYLADGKEIDPKLIDDLVAAINSPPVKKLDLANLGITQAWLAENSEVAIRDTRSEDASPKQKDLFVTSFRNMTSIEKAIADYYKGGWTDDYPRFDLTLVCTNGKRTRLRSQAQHAFMVPWKITGSGMSSLTYNAEIGRAIARILPDEFTNQGRLQGNRLRSRLARSIMDQIHVQWYLLDTEQKVGDQLDGVKQRYTLKTSVIGSYYNTGELWKATLEGHGLPPNGVIGIDMPIVDGRVSGLNLFLERIDSLVDLAFSVPWLTKYLKENPQTKIELRFVEDRSLKKTDLNRIDQNLSTFGKQRLFSQIEADLERSVLLQIKNGECFSMWIVLPDQRMLLWYAQFCRAVLKWQASEFKKKDTSAFLLVSKNGAILER